MNILIEIQLLNHYLLFVFFAFTQFCRFRNQEGRWVGGNVLLALKNATIQ